MSRLQCYAPGCESLRHYDGSHCGGTDTTVDHYIVYDSPDCRTPHNHCRCHACHSGGYGSGYITRCEGNECGPHCERYICCTQKFRSDTTAGRSGVTLRETDSSGCCIVCGSYSHRGSRHGDMWWTAIKTGKTPEDVDKALAVLRTTDECPAGKNKFRQVADRLPCSCGQHQEEASVALRATESADSAPGDAKG